MVYVVTRWWYPSHKQDEVNKKYQKALKDGPPEGVIPVGELVVNGAQKGSKDGIVGMGFVKVAPEDIAQALTNAILILSNYSEIEGYEGNVEVWADITEFPG